MKNKAKRIGLAFLSCVVLLSVSVVFADDSVSRLDDVVVTGTKTEHTLQDVPVETIVITKEDIEKQNSQNVMDLLKSVPGIQSAYHNDVFGTYTWVAKMRGLDFDSGYALVLIDGQRAMGCGQSGGMGEYGVGLNQIPVEMIERIEIVKGPGSALYGSDAMAGVINIITKKVPKDAMGSAGVAYGRYDVKRENTDGTEDEGNGSRVLSKTYVSYGDRITDNTGYFLHYNYESSDDISEDPVESWRHSFMGKVDSKLNDKTDVSIKAEVSEYEKDGNRDEDSYRLSAAFDYKPGPGQILSFKAYTYKWDFLHGYPGYSYGYKFGDVGYNQAEVQYTRDINDTNTLVVGAEFQEQGIDYIIENSDSSIVRVNEDVTTSSVFIQDEAVLFDKLTLIGGARYDHHSTFGSEINPKFSLMYQPRTNTKIRFSAGTSFKSPTIRQLYYDTPYWHGSYYARSNPDLKPEKGVGYSASIEQWLMDQQVMVDLGVFRNEIEDMVIREDTGTLYNGQPLREYRNVEEGVTQGIELLCKAYFTDEFSTSLSYTFTDTENKESGNELTYTSRHSASFTPAYDWEKYGAGVSATITYNSKQYTNSSNTSQIDEGAAMNMKIYKQLSEKAKLSFEADDIFDSVPSRDGRYHAGRTYMVKLDFVF